MELGVMPDVEITSYQDSNGDELENYKMPYMGTKGERDAWQKKKDKANDWAHFVLQMLEDGLEREQAMIIAKECISVEMTPKQGAATYKRALDAAAKKIRGKKEKDVPKPEAYGDWS